VIPLAGNFKRLSMSDDAAKELLIGRLSRLIGSGVDYNDAIGVISAMKEIAGWSRGWESAGDAHLERGDAALAAGNKVIFHEFDRWHPS